MGKFERTALTGTTKTKGDFHLSGAFTVEIDSITVGGFWKVEGLEHEHETVEYQDSDDHTTHFRPGRSKTGLIRLERDWSSTPDLFNWFKTVIDGRVARKSVAIIYKNDKGDDASRFQLYETWPKKWSVQGFNSKASGHASEIIEIVYERMEFKTG